MGTVTGADTNKQPINRISVSTCQNHISSDIPHRILLNLEQEFPLIFYLYSKGLYMKGEILGRRNKRNWRKRGRGKGRRGRKKRKKAERKEEGARLLLQQCARSNYFHSCLLLMWRKPVLNYQMSIRSGHIIFNSQVQPPLFGKLELNLNCDDNVSSPLHEWPSSWVTWAGLFADSCHLLSERFTYIWIPQSWSVLTTSFW